MGSTPVEDIPCQIWYYPKDLYYGLEVIRPSNSDSDEEDEGDHVVRKEIKVHEDKVELVWVTPKSKLNRVESAWIAYGNQASLDYLYGDVFLSVELRRLG